MHSEAQEAKANALCALLDREPEALAAALEGVEPEELPYVHWKGDSYFSVWGTVLAVAAAKNKTAHMALLLDRGWDLEGGVHPEQCASWDLGTNPASPLSAAIVGGSTEAARLLRERGARSWDCGTVCRTALLLLDMEDGRYVPCIRAALGLEEDADIRRELLRRVPPHWIIAICTPEELRVCLRSGRHDAAELVRTIQTVDSYRSVSHAYQKLLILSEEAPEGFREQRELKLLLTGALTIAYCISPPVWEETGLALLARWRELSGPERDVSAALPFLWREQPKEARRTLGMLGEGASALRADGAWFAAFREEGSRNGAVILDALTEMYVSEEGREEFLEHFACHQNQLLQILRAKLLDRELALAAAERAITRTKNPALRAKLLVELHTIV